MPFMTKRSPKNLCLLTVNQTNVRLPLYLVLLLSPSPDDDVCVSFWLTHGCIGDLTGWWTGCSFLHRQVCSVLIEDRVF